MSTCVLSQTTTDSDLTTSEPLPPVLSLSFPGTLAAIAALSTAKGPAHALDLPLAVWGAIASLLDNLQDQRHLFSCCKVLRPLVHPSLLAIKHLTVSSHKDILSTPLHSLFPAATTIALASSFFACPEFLFHFLSSQLEILTRATSISADLQIPCPQSPIWITDLLPFLTSLRSLSCYNLNTLSPQFLAHLPIATTLRRLAISAHPTLNPQGPLHPIPPALAPALPALPLLTHLTLANFPLTTALAAAIGRLPALRALVLRATPSTTPAILALAASPHLPSLTSLSIATVLSHPRGDSTDPAAWAALLATTCSLTSLTISLPTLPPSHTFLPRTLQTLCLTTPHNIAPYLPHLPSLTSLSWHGHHLAPPEYEIATADSISQLAALQRLDLGLMSLPAEEIGRIHYLSELTSLTSIQLSHHIHQYCWSPANLPQWCPASVTFFNKAATPRAGSACPRPMLSH